MVWLILLLHAGAALADEPAAPPQSEEPLYCTDPVTAVCDRLDKALPDYAATRAQLEELLALQANPVELRARFAQFQEMEKQSFIPLLDESRTRLLDAVESIEGLEAGDRATLKATLSKVKFVSLSGAPDAMKRIATLRKSLPKTSILRQKTPEAIDVVVNLKFDRMTPEERDLVRLLLQTKVLERAQERACGESVPLNAFSMGAAWGIPSVSLCLDSVLRLKPLDVQTRYPILGMVFGHELGHHLDTGPYPDLYKKYLSCLHEEVSDGAKKFSDNWAAEISADFWSAAALGNMIKTRAALLEEPPEAERSRALRFVRGSLQWLCSVPAGPGETHPPATFRIGKVFGQSPEIRRMVGCKPKPLCGLSGRR